MWTVDFETEAIEDRPNYPPKPVGVAIKEPGGKSYYLAWGHSCENNCTYEKAKRILTKIWKSRQQKLFHNASFDMEVAEKWFGLPLLKEHEFEDSMFVAFLFNPRARKLGLKELAADILHMPPDEQGELRDWIKENLRKSDGKVIPDSKVGEYIARAPGTLVGKYAIGDVERTRRLFDTLLPEIKHWDMMEPYLVEKRILPIVLKMESTGIRLDAKRLENDLKHFEKEYEKIERGIKRKLGDINLNAGQQIADAMEARGMVNDSGWQYTEKGNRKTGRESLASVCKDKNLVSLLDKHSRLSKVLSTYMRPWNMSASENNGIFYPWFNQVRGDDGYGTKTGRFSSNFQQVPKEPDDPWYPFMRNYVVCDKPSHILTIRDFSQQELRILAEYEEGDLYEAYLKDPFVDIHAMVGDLIKARANITLIRAIIKIANFLMVYGGGVEALSTQAKMEYYAAMEVVQAHQKALPGVKKLMKEITLYTKNGGLIRTAGGRVYSAEAGFWYKMLNTLIQSSAADHTKRSMIRIDQAYQHIPETRIMITVHDEFISSTPERILHKSMRVFREAMEDDDLFNIAMLSDGKYGKTWGSATKYADRRK